MVDLRPATDADAAWLAPRLRAGDLAELQAAHGAGVDVLRVLRQAVDLSDEPLAACVGGEPIALLGCAPVSLLGREAAPWMLGSEPVARHAREAVVLGRRAVAAWSQRYRLLENWADARNTLSLRWLARIGFEIHAPAPHGALGLPFCRFTRSAYT